MILLRAADPLPSDDPVVRVDLEDVLVAVCAGVVIDTLRQVAVGSCVRLDEIVDLELDVEEGLRLIVEGVVDGRGVARRPVRIGDLDLHLELGIAVSAHRDEELGLTFRGGQVTGFVGVRLVGPTVVVVLRGCLTYTDVEVGISLGPEHLDGDLCTGLDGVRTLVNPLTARDLSIEGECTADALGGLFIFGDTDKLVCPLDRDGIHLGDAVAANGLVPDLDIHGSVFDKGLSLEAEEVGHEYVVGARVGVPALLIVAGRAIVLVVLDLVLGVVFVAA